MILIGRGLDLGRTDKREAEAEDAEATFQGEDGRPWSGRKESRPCAVLKVRGGNAKAQCKLKRQKAVGRPLFGRSDVAKKRGSKGRLHRRFPVTIA